jgi:hypothetical protein
VTEITNIGVPKNVGVALQALWGRCYVLNVCPLWKSRLGK